jgi:hypothetical protein
MKKFGVLIPIKISGVELSSAQKDSLSNLGKTFPHNEEVGIYLGLDEERKSCSLEVSLRDLFREFEVHVQFTYFQKSYAGNICYFWRQLATIAYDDGCHLFCLLGDDVEIHTSNWIGKIVKEFEDLHQELSLPPELSGFGCIAINDAQCPGFPTFPVVSRLHFELNGNKLFSDDFINQDADPYLFQLYRRFGASRFSKTVRLTNHIGGVELPGDLNYVVPRYERHHVDWKKQVDETMNRFLANEKFNLSRFYVFTVDIIVPSFRCSRDYIERFLALRSSHKDVDVNYIIIVDNPAVNVDWLVAIGKERNDVRVRRNKENKGAPHSRNVGMNESGAEYCLFLDDDVIPDENIIDEYISMLRLNKDKYDGFVGYTELPSPVNLVYHTAVHFSGVSFFWSAPTTMKEVPWGITANLFVKNSSCRFNENFSKKGGGGRHRLLSQIE